MKNIIFILLLLLLSSGQTNSQSSDSSIIDIRNKYQHIRNNLSTYVTSTIEFSNESTEGAKGTAYYDGNDIKLIEVIRLGETGKEVIEYYFDSGKLFFVFNQDYDYNRPIYWNKKMAKENNDKEVFDQKKTNIKEDRYYFRNESLFYWLNNEKDEVDLTIEKNSIIGQTLIFQCMQNEK